MKRWSLSFAIAAALAGGAAAQTASAASSEYYVTNLPSLGGTVARGNSINDLGLISGYSNLSGDGSRHAAAWLFGRVTDLNTLGGANSAVPWPVKNNFGVVSGVSQTDQPQQLGESWSCVAGGFIPDDGHTCLGFVWAFGRMRALKPLPGGNNSFATGTNTFMQTVGWAETGYVDPTCNIHGDSDQVLQFLPVVWGPGKNQIKSLPLETGDDSGAATALNDRGQIVGISGICDQAVGRETAKHAVLWENGHLTDLGNLGALWFNTPMAINQHGVVVGFAGDADPANFNGDVTHAFIWTRDGGMQRINPDADDNSIAYGLNERNQVVGFYVFTDGSLHGFVWDAKHGMRDLNDPGLKQAGYTDVITVATDINDLGVITGRAFDPATNEKPAFMAVPTHAH